MKIYAEIIINDSKKWDEIKKHLEQPGSILRCEFVEAY